MKCHAAMPRLEEARLAYAGLGRPKGMERRRSHCHAALRAQAGRGGYMARLSGGRPTPLSPPAKARGPAVHVYVHPTLKKVE